jgi:hypothetical protein
MVEGECQVQPDPRQPAAEQLNERDLWRAREINRGQLSVELVFWQADEPLFVKTVWGPAWPSAENHGVQTRELLVWTAIARFLNAGGDPDYLRMRCAEVFANICRITVPGMFLMETSQDNVEAQHVWVNPQENQALLFTEDSRIERMTIPAMYRHVSLDAQKRKALEDARKTPVGGDGPPIEADDHPRP